jgi:hypothetical protein
MQTAYSVASAKPAPIADPREPLALLRLLETLDMDGVDSALRDSALRDASNGPQPTPTAHRLADRRKRASGEVVLVVTVGITDNERFCRHAWVMSAFANAKPLSPRRLHAFLAHRQLARRRSWLLAAAHVVLAGPDISEMSEWSRGGRAGRGRSPAGTPAARRECGTIAHLVARGNVNALTGCLAGTKRGRLAVRPPRSHPLCEYLAAPRVGLEPTTLRLTAGCSAN